MKYILVKKNKIIQEGGNNNPFIRNGIVLRDSRYGGKGVFTTEPITEGDTIEISPFLIIPTNDISSENILKNYVFKHDNNYSSLVLGYGSMYNHNDNPNVQYYFNDDEKTMFLYKAIRNIEANEELCISYGDNYWKEREKII